MTRRRAAPGCFATGRDDRPARGGGVDGGGQGAGGADEEGEQNGLGQELDADVAFGGAEGAAPYPVAQDYVVVAPEKQSVVLTPSTERRVSQLHV